MGEPEKFHRRKFHLIPHQGDGIPWRRNLSGSYVPGESTKPRKFSPQQEFKQLLNLLREKLAFAPIKKEHTTCTNIQGFLIFFFAYSN